MKERIFPMEERIWTVPFFLVLFITLSFNITMTMMMPILPLYLAAQGDIAAGAAVGIFTFAALASRPFFGKLLDSRSRTFVLILGSSIIVLSCAAYRLMELSGAAWAALMIIRIMHGVGYSAGTNATGTLAADCIPPARRGEGLGYYGVVFAASLALGPALALQLFQHNRGNFNAVFMAMAGITLFGLVVTVTLNRLLGTKQSAGKEHKAQGEKAEPVSIIEKTALPGSVTMIFVSFAYSAVMSFLAKYSISLNLGNMSIFFLCYAGTLFVTRIFIGQYTDKHGMHRALPAGIAGMTVTFILLGVTGMAVHISLFIAAAVLYGFGYGIVQPALNTIVMSACAPNRRGAANATFFGCMDLGLGSGAVAWGIFSGAFGYPAMYFGCVLFMAAALVCYIRLFPRAPIPL
jgi:MFS family permease